MRKLFSFFRFLLVRHSLLSVLMACALAGAGWFAWSFVQEARYFADPAHHEQPLEPWMSPRYVGKSWDLPPETIVRIMALEQNHAQPTLAHVTAHLGITLPQLEARVRAAEARRRGDVPSASPTLPTGAR